MKSIAFNEANTKLIADPDILPGTTDTIACKTKTGKGFPVYISKWQLTPEEREEFIRNGSLWLIIAMEEGCPPAEIRIFNPFGEEKKEPGKLILLR